MEQKWDRIESRLDRVWGTIKRIEQALATHGGRVDVIETRVALQHDALLTELTRIRTELAGINKRLDTQNGRVRKLELWRAEMTARTGVIAALVSAAITVALTVVGWWIKIKGG